MALRKPRQRLFSPHLPDHPAVCPATYKETRFFLSDDYPLPSKYRYKGDIEEYNLLFSNSDETQLRMESTPDYLYCEKARERIAASLPDAKLVFSLREPDFMVDLVVSICKTDRQIATNLEF